MMTWRPFDASLANANMANNDPDDNLLGLAVGILFSGRTVDEERQQQRFNEVFCCTGSFAVSNIACVERLTSGRIRNSFSALKEGAHTLRLVYYVVSPA